MLIFFFALYVTTTTELYYACTLYSVAHTTKGYVCITFTPQWNTYIHNKVSTASLYLECDFYFSFTSLGAIYVLSSVSSDPFKILYLLTISLAGMRQHVWVCISYGMWMGVVEEGDIKNNNTCLYDCFSKMKNVPSEHLILRSLWCDGNTCRTLNPKILFFSFCIVWLQNGVAMGLVKEVCSVPLCRILNLHLVTRRTEFRADTTHRSAPRLYAVMLSRQYTMGAENHTYPKYTYRIYTEHVLPSSITEKRKLSLGSSYSKRFEFVKGGQLLFWNAKDLFYYKPGCCNAKKNFFNRIIICIFVCHKNEQSIDLTILS